MKLKFLLIACAIMLTQMSYAQDVATLTREAITLEKQMKEMEALVKYKAIIASEPKNVNALVKAAELTAAIGTRFKKDSEKIPHFKEALQLAQDAAVADSTSADAWYVLAMASGKMTEVAENNKQTVAYVKDIYTYASKALAINPNHSKANYVMGKWHLSMVTLNFVKKAAVKALYGGLPKADINEAIRYMENCRKNDVYFITNYLDLAKAYEELNKPTKVIEILNLLVKMPLRTVNDAAIKEEGKQMLAKYQ
ncbi:MAG: hypothetical protein ACK4HE_06065 [Chitinophagaceae bacterium]